jgi:hypothetical protein
MASTARWARWKAHLALCLLLAAALTAFLMHIGAADPWMGGIAVPATVWVAWMAIDIARASHHRVRQRREAARRNDAH